MEKNWLAQIQWNTDGLIPVIVQEQGSKDVLMMAWMNSDTLYCIVLEKHILYACLRFVLT